METVTIAIPWIRSFWKDIMDEEVQHLPEDTIRRLFAAFEKLPDFCQEVCSLHYFEKHTVIEISEILDIHEELVKHRLAVANSMMKALLRQVRQ